MCGERINKEINDLLKDMEYQLKKTPSTVTLACLKYSTNIEYKTLHNF